LSTNHGGGVAIAASRGVRLTAAINTGNRKCSFQHVEVDFCAFEPYNLTSGGIKFLLIFF